MNANGCFNDIRGGDGNDTINLTNDWGNPGHPGNWSISWIDLSLGGTNRVEIKGNTNTSGPTRAEITLGHGTDTILAGDHTVVTILGANSTGNANIALHGSVGHQGAVHTGTGHTTINWHGGNYDFHFGSGDLTFTAHGDVHHRFVFDGSGRTATDHFVLNNWREGGFVHTGEGHTTIGWYAGNYLFEFGSGDLTFTAGGDLYQRFVFDGSERTANDTLILNNWREGGVVHTGEGDTTIHWNHGDYGFQFGDGDLTFTAGGDLHHRFYFNGSDRTANDTLILNNWREGGFVFTGHGQTEIDWRHGDYDFQFGSGDLTFRTGGDLHLRFVFDGSERTANDTLILNNWREGGVVHTGQGHTDVTLNYGKYDFHLGSGGVSMSVHGHAGFSTIYDADGNLIVGRVDGQSPVAEAVHTFSAGEGINLDYSLKLGYGVDKVQFYAGSGHYQVTSSENADIFQLDIVTGGTEGATYEVFDFKWGTDQIISDNGIVLDELLLQDGHVVRFQYMGEENGQHAFDLVSIWDLGAYDAGHVWMTVYSQDLPELNFL